MTVILEPLLRSVPVLARLRRQPPPPAPEVLDAPARLDLDEDAHEGVSLIRGKATVLPPLQPAIPTQLSAHRDDHDDDPDRGLAHDDFNYSLDFTGATVIPIHPLVLPDCHRCGDRAAKWTARLDDGTERRMPVCDLCRLHVKGLAITSGGRR